MRRRWILSGVAAALVGNAGCAGGAGGGTADDAEEPTATTTEDGTAGLAAVTLVPREECPDPGAATVSFDTDPVTIRGCVVGKNGCTQPRLTSIERDAEAVRVVVAAVEERDEGEACTEVLRNLGYEVRLGYETPPTDVTVVHDGVHGRRVVTDAVR